MPRLSLWHDGYRINAHWVPDFENAYSSMPGQFQFGSSVRLNPIDVEDALREFIIKVLGWVESVSDPRVARLQSNWKAIVDASPEEASFCRAAGHMGLDPYELSTWPEELPQFIETTLSDAEPKPLANDFLSAVEPVDAVPLWKWVDGMQKSEQLQCTTNEMPVPLNMHGHAGQAGFEAAYKLRRKFEIDTNQKIERVTDLAGALECGQLTFHEHNHVPSKSVIAAVGWHQKDGAVIAGPVPSASTDRRFMQARGLFHASFMCQDGPRLITRAHDWDQQASRGFAAEILAPRRALLEHLSGVDDDDRASYIDELANKYEVSSLLISRQLQNAEWHGDSVG